MGPLFILIGIVVGVLVAVVLLNKLLHVLSIHLGFIYWPITVLVTIFIFFATTQPGYGLIPADNLQGEHYGMIFFIHFLHAYFLIPMMDGDSGSYFTYSSYQDGNYTVTTRSEESYYTPGWWKKLIAQAIIGGIAMVVAIVSDGDLLWIVFIVEVVYTGYLSLIAILNKFGHRR